MVTESIAIKPSPWEAMPAQSKEEFSVLSYGIAVFIEREGTKFDRFQKLSFDLFLLYFYACMKQKPVMRGRLSETDGTI